VGRRRDRFPGFTDDLLGQVDRKERNGVLAKKLVIAYRADVRALEGAVIWKAVCAGWEDWKRLAVAAGGGGQAARNDGCA